MTNHSTVDLIHQHSSSEARPRLTVDWLFFVPSLAALALFIPHNQNFGFDSPGWLDAFYYVGYFWHFPEHLPLFDNYYKASRLPWLLPGFVAHRLFGETAGSYLLHWATLAAGGSAIYLLLRATLNDRMVAVIVGVAWVCSTAGHGVGGWNHHVVAAAAYYLLACWLVVRAAQSSSQARIVLAGAAFACAVHTHLFYAVFAPFVAWLYLAALPRSTTWRSRRVVADAALMATGGAVLTASLMAVNRASGGFWLFFMPQVNYLIWISQPGNNAWWLEAGRWLPTAKYLVMPLLCLCAGTISLRAPRTGEPWRFGLAFVLQGWAALLIFSYYQFVEKQSVLDHDYMAFGLYCHAFPALGVALLRARTRGWLEGRTYVPEALAACAFVVGALLFGMPTALPDLLQRVQSAFGSSLPLVVPPLVVGLAGLLVIAVMPARVRILALAGWFSVMNVWLAPSARAYGLGTPGIHRTMLKLFRDADRFTSQLDPSLDAIEYWFVQEPIETPQGVVDLAAVFDSYVSTRGWLGNLLAQKSPGLPVDQLGREQFRGVTCLGVLSSVGAHSRLRAQLVARLSQYAVVLDPVGSRQFDGQDVSFALSVFRVRLTEEAKSEKGRRGGPPCRP